MPEPYTLVPTPKFSRQLSKLDHFVAKNIDHYLKEVARSGNPTSKGKGLRYELTGQWRYRIGDYRVLVKIDAGELTILALSVGHRREVYKKP